VVCEEEEGVKRRRRRKKKLKIINIALALFITNAPIIN